MRILYCGIPDDYSKLSSEIRHRFDYDGEYISSTDLEISLNSIRRIVKRNDVLLVDLEFMSNTVAMALALAAEYNLEIVGFYAGEEPPATRYTDVCEAIYDIDDVIDHFI